MFKKLVLAILTVCLAVLTAAPVYAQTAPVVVTSMVEAKFPLELNFNITARSTASITEIRLHYAVGQLGFAEVNAEAFLEFSPATSVTTSWKWDMRKSGGLPPGTVIDYWWTVVDAGSGRTTTTPQRITFDDTRFSWQKITQGKVTILWYSGQQSFAEEIMLAARQALERLTNDTGAYLREPVRIYIYSNSNDLRGSMIFPQEWTGGVAFTRFGCIAIGISPTNLSWGKRAIAHELTHLVTHQMTLNPYNDLPTWLEEGIAMVNEGTMLPEFSSRLKTAINNNTLISVQTLSSPFSADANKSYLSYAESYSIVDYLIKTYGKDKMFQLLETFRQGSTYDGALLRVYGFDTAGLDARWRQVIGVRTVQGEAPSETAPEAIWIAVAVPVFAALVFVARRRLR